MHLTHSVRRACASSMMRGMHSPATHAKDRVRKSILERFLGLFTDVQGGEGITALLLMVNVYLLLTTYYIIKPVREALILAGSGAEVKSYSSAAQAILLLVAVPAYARLASRLPRRGLINAVTWFFVACLLGFYLLAKLGVPNLGVVFFIWVGIFNMMVIAQFWSFANDVYTPEQGKRLFPLVAFGASFGAVSGSVLTGRLIAPFGVEQLLLVAAAILAATLILTNSVDAHERARRRVTAAGASAPRETQATADRSELGNRGAFELVLRHRYLLLIALLMLFLNWVNTTGEYILGRVVERNAADAVTSGLAGGLSEGQYIGKFYADFYSMVNIAGVVLQLFVVSRVLKYLGVRVGLLCMPVIALTGYALLVVYPLLAAVRWVKIAENATDYSLQNTVRNVLFLPTTREQKYKAKQAIDSFFVRVGDVLSAGLVFVGTSILAFETSHFALVNLVLVCIWIVLAVRIGRAHHALVAPDQPV